MRQRERIPLHDHSNLNSGGLIKGSTLVALTGGEVGGGSGATTGGTTLDDGTAAGDRLRWSGSTWEPSSLIWRPVMTYDGTNWLVAVDGSGNAILTEA